jgi:putative mRNA 3-end processing factor
MKRRPRSPVVWRDGVHIAGTPLWCDARRARELCFVSSALVPDARRHRQIIATQATLDLLPEPPARALAVPYGRPFALGDLRLELFPSGPMVGAAALLVDLGPTRVVYAGPVDPRRGAEARACDLLVVDATGVRFEPPAPVDALAGIAAWVDAELGAGATPVLLASPLSTGPELIERLGATRPLRAHRAFVDAARKLRELGRPLPPVLRFAGPPAPGTVVLWPPGSRDAPAMRALRRVSMTEVSDPRDGPSLVAYVAATGARTVFLVGASDDRLERALVERGLEARRFGPPEQLALFASRAPMR